MRPTVNAGNALLTVSPAVTLVQRRPGCDGQSYIGGARREGFGLERLDAQAAISTGFSDFEASFLSVEHIEQIWIVFDGISWS